VYKRENVIIVLFRAARSTGQAPDGGVVYNLLAVNQATVVAP